MDEQAAIGSLMARHTAAYAAGLAGSVRYLLIPLTSHPDRNIQQVLSTCVDGYGGYSRSQTFIGTSGLNDDHLWKTLC